MLRPMLSSPTRRLEAASSAGGGAITAACGACTALRDVLLTLGGGAMTERSISGASRVISDASTTGTGAIGMRGLSAQATVLGNATSCCN